MTKRLTPEDKAAKKIIEVVNDLTLDLDVIGSTIAHIAHNVSLNRLITVVDTAEDEREIIHNRRKRYL